MYAYIPSFFGFPSHSITTTIIPSKKERMNLSSSFIKLVSSKFQNDLLFFQVDLNLKDLSSLVDLCQSSW